MRPQRAMQTVLKWTAVLVVSLVPAWASAQSDPTAIGAGQKPYIMLLMDTSASMEWTDKGDESYPRTVQIGSNGQPVTCQPGQGCGSGFTCEGGVCLSDETWSANADIVSNPGGNSNNGGYGDVGDDPVRYGPCYMWEPTCNDYERPAWYPTEDWTEAYGESMESRLEAMKNSTSTRMRDQAQPRHVTLKEVLTGDMLLRDSSTAGLPVESLDAQTNAPGCWIVPRQRGAPAAQVQVCGGEARFEDLPDFDEPRPHFQEVFEEQKPNGLMDLLATNAIFSVAMFDGYRSKQVWEGSLDDPINGSFAGIEEQDGEQGRNYNLGVYEILTPSDLDVSTSLLGQISTFMQVALVDAGYLSEKTGSKRKLKAGSAVSNQLPFLNLVFTNPLKDYLKDYDLAKQPIARATPLAAAVYDIHQFFSEDYGDDPSDEVYDEYLTCRPKQVIILTDGYPEPEAPGGVALTENSANSVFGYDAGQYPYTYTENAIESFMLNQLHTGSGPAPQADYLMNWNADGAYRYNPRVHVVGLNVDGSDENVVRKLAEMAKAGRTCASHFLGPDYIPTTNGGNCTVNDGDPTTNCLDPRQGELDPSVSCDDCFVPWNGDGSQEACEYPALILENNSREALTGALQQLFNYILETSGTSTRTTPTFVGRLDDTVSTYAAGGQYRVFSGVQIEGVNPYWKGLVFREAQLCDTNASGGLSTGNYIGIHDEIESLGGLQGNPDAGDRRRIFTTFASLDTYDYTTNTPKRMSDTSRFGYLRKFLNTSSFDEFGSSYLSGDTGLIDNGRIPMEASTLKGAYEAINLVLNNNSDVYSYFGAGDEAGLRSLMHQVRGRTDQQLDRLLGGILNGSPVGVEPPSLDIPIDSYRDYRARHGDRLSMVYVPTIDGMLHAIYTGDVDSSDNTTTEVIVRDGRIDVSGTGWSKSDGAGDLHEQREAWAYIPQMLHKKYSNFRGQQPYLMDGTPVVKDVRLCNRDDADNQNKQVCAPINEGGVEIVPTYEQWRTVLVQGLGLAGAGYFALDVTRPGGPQFSGSPPESPDPLPIWEFDPNWEMGQILEMDASDRADLVHPRAQALLDGDGKDSEGNSYIGGGNDSCEDDQSDPGDYFWNQPFLGTSVGEAAIGTLIVDDEFGAGGKNVRRPVAVISGGDAGDHGTLCDRAERSGRAVYVIDLQTGTMLRRFVDYLDENGEYKRFSAPVTGSPALHNSFTGSLVTRGFVGDADGRLFRLDLGSSDPAEWELSLFFDPSDNLSELGLTTSNLGPAAFKPALALGTAATGRDLLIFYGLGEPGDTNPAGQAQTVIALREKFDGQQFNNTPTASAELIWNINLGDDGSNGGSVVREKLTGEPVVFNNAVYFTTYAVVGEDVCTAGNSRIWGVEFEGEVDAVTGAPTGNVVGVWDTTNDTEFAQNSASYDFGPGTPSVWFSPTEPVVIRGLAVTLGPSCSTSTSGSSGGFNEEDDRKPTLVAQTGSTGGGSSSSGGLSKSVGSGVGALSRIEKTLEAPTSQNIPLSWKVIRN